MATPIILFYLYLASLNVLEENHIEVPASAWILAALGIIFALVANLGDRK
jgi:hypothetical protein